MHTASVRRHRGHRRLASRSLRRMQRERGWHLPSASFRGQHRGDGLGFATPAPMLYTVSGNDEKASVAQFPLGARQVGLCSVRGLRSGSSQYSSLSLCHGCGGLRVERGARARSERERPHQVRQRFPRRQIQLSERRRATPHPARRMISSVPPGRSRVRATHDTHGNRFYRPSYCRTGRRGESALASG